MEKDGRVAAGVGVGSTRGVKINSEEIYRHLPLGEPQELS